MMNIKDIQGSIQDNLEIIKEQKRYIELYERKIAETTDVNKKRNFEIYLNETKKRILQLELENEESKLDLKLAEIDELKEDLKKRLEKGEFSFKQEYFDKNFALSRYSKIIQDIFELRTLDIQIKIGEIISSGQDNKQEEMKRKRQEKWQSLQSDIKRHKRLLVAFQEEKGIISSKDSKQVKKEINSKDYSIDDASVDSLSSEMDFFLDDMKIISERLKENESLSDYIVRNNPKMEVFYNENPSNDRARNNTSQKRSRTEEDRYSKGDPHTQEVLEKFDKIFGKYGRNETRNSNDNEQRVDNKPRIETKLEKEGRTEAKEAMPYFRENYSKYKVDSKTRIETKLEKGSTEGKEATPYFRKNGAVDGKPKVEDEIEKRSNEGKEFNSSSWIEQMRNNLNRARTVNIEARDLHDRVERMSVEKVMEAKEEELKKEAQFREGRSSRGRW